MHGAEPNQPPTAYIRYYRYIIYIYIYSYIFIYTSWLEMISCPHKHTHTQKKKKNICVMAKTPGVRWVGILLLESLMQFAESLNLFPDEERNLDSYDGTWRQHRPAMQLPCFWRSHRGRHGVQQACGTAKGNPKTCLAFWLFTAGKASEKFKLCT